MIRHIGRLALVAGLGIGAFVLADAFVPSFDIKRELGEPKDAVEPEIVSTPSDNN